MLEALGFRASRIGIVGLCGARVKGRMAQFRAIETSGRSETAQILRDGKTATYSGPCCDNENRVGVYHFLSIIPKTALVYFGL